MPLVSRYVGGSPRGRLPRVALDEIGPRLRLEVVVREQVADLDRCTAGPTCFRTAGVSTSPNAIFCPTRRHEFLVL